MYLSNFTNVSGRSVFFNKFLHHKFKYTIFAIKIISNLMLIVNKTTL